MPQSASPNQKTIGLVLLLIAAALVLWGQGERLSPIKNLISIMLTPAQSWVAERFPPVSSPVLGEVSLESLRSRNTELESEVDRLENEVARLREAEAERNMLSELLQFAREHRQHSYLAAEVIGRDPSPFLRFLILNKGTLDGVGRDLPVVSAKGLVGLITEAMPHASKMLLITDPRMAINVRLQESRADGVLVGQASGTLRLKFLSADAQVEAGNVAMTSGMGGSFPSEIPVGTVSSVRRRLYEVFQEAEIAPAADFSRLEIVLIITDFIPLDLNPLLSEPEGTNP